MRTSERGRIENILDAVRSADWMRFRSLTDLPFLNEQSMKSQFEAVAGKVELVSDNIAESTSANSAGVGVRMINVSLKNLENGSAYTLMVHNTVGKSEREDKMRILAIAPEYTYPGDR